MYMYICKYKLTRGQVQLIWIHFHSCVNSDVFFVSSDVATSFQIAYNWVWCVNSTSMIQKL